MYQDSNGQWNLSEAEQRRADLIEDDARRIICTVASVIVDLSPLREFMSKEAFSSMMVGVEDAIVEAVYSKFCGLADECGTSGLQYPVSPERMKSQLEYEKRLIATNPATQQA